MSLEMKQYEIMWDDKDVTQIEGISSLCAYIVAAAERIKNNQSSTHYYVKCVQSGRMVRFTHHSEERLPWQIDYLLKPKYVHDDEQFSCPMPDSVCDKHKINDEEGQWEFCNTCKKEWAR